jgi:hypothetical protein
MFCGPHRHKNKGKDLFCVHLSLASLYKSNMGKARKSSASEVKRHGLAQRDL